MVEKLPVKCPCGRLVKTTPTNIGAKTMICPSCKRRIRYEVVGNKVYVSYV